MVESILGLGDNVTGYSECGGGNGPTCPQSGPAALDGGSEEIISYLKATKDLEVVFRRRT